MSPLFFQADESIEKSFHENNIDVVKIGQQKAESTTSFHQNFINPVG
jgi:hypothetical protein